MTSQSDAPGFLAVVTRVRLAADAVVNVSGALTNVVPFDTVDEDGGAHWDAVNKRFTSPFPADYEVHFHVGINAGTNGLYLATRINTVAVPRTVYRNPVVAVGAGAVNDTAFDWEGGVTLATNDKLDFVVAADNAGNRTLSGGYCWAEIWRIG